MPGCTRLSGACGGSLARACVFSVRLVFSASKARAHTQYIGHLHLPDLRESLSTSLISRASLRLRTKEDTVCLGLSLDTAATAGAPSADSDASSPAVPPSASAPGRAWARVELAEGESLGKVGTRAREALLSRMSLASASLARLAA